MLLIFLDTETTGLNPEKHRAIELAFHVIDSITERHVSSYETLITQPIEIWAEADLESIKINGFSWEDLLKGKSEKVVAVEVADILNQAGIQEKSGVFICQNPSFDRAFFSQIINQEMQDSYGWPYHWLDLASMYWAMRIFKTDAGIKWLHDEDLSKDKIAEFFGLPPETFPHRAKNGVDHLIACYKALFSL